MQHSKSHMIPHRLPTQTLTSGGQCSVKPSQGTCGWDSIQASACWVNVLTALGFVLFFLTCKLKTVSLHAVQYSCKNYIYPRLPLRILTMTEQLQTLARQRGHAVGGLRASGAEDDQFVHAADGNAAGLVLHSSTICFWWLCIVWKNLQYELQHCLIGCQQWICSPAL